MTETLFPIRRCCCLCWPFLMDFAHECENETRPYEIPTECRRNRRVWICIIVAGWFLGQKRSNTEILSGSSFDLSLLSHCFRQRTDGDDESIFMRPTSDRDFWIKENTLVVWLSLSRQSRNKLSSNSVP